MNAQRRARDNRELRIALLAPPLLPQSRAAPDLQRVLAALTAGLRQRGHEVSLFGSGDPRIGSALTPLAAEARWLDWRSGDPESWVAGTVDEVQRRHGRFDVIHSNLGVAAFDFASSSRTPVLTTMHERMDAATCDLLGEFWELPLVAVHEDQPRWCPANWVGCVRPTVPLPKRNVTVSSVVLTNSCTPGAAPSRSTRGPGGPSSSTTKSRSRISSTCRLTEPAIATRRTPGMVRNTSAKALASARAWCSRRTPVDCRRNSIPLRTFSVVFLPKRGNFASRPSRAASSSSCSGHFRATASGG